MKRYFVLFIALITLSVSCKKSSSSSSPSNSISVTLNGTSKNFVSMPLATKTVFGGVTAIEIIGGLPTGESIAIQIGNDLSYGVDSIVAGTYSDTSSHFSVSVNYLSLNGGNPITYSGGTDVDGSQALSNPVVTNHLKIVITSISTTAIKGTFSGNLYLSGDPGQAIWPATNGSFDLALTTQ